MPELINESDENANLEFAVIGRVSAVSKHTAKIDTIINKDCRLSVIIPENGATGILKGGGRNGNELWTEIVYFAKRFKIYAR